MYTYCGNNPINRKDPNGQGWIAAMIIVAVVAVFTIPLYGCTSQSSHDSHRNKLANAPALDIDTAPEGSYNCYGNAIQKQIFTAPYGYTAGDSTEATFNAVVNDLGANNVRRLNSIDDPIKNDEYKVALKCGTEDFHFIRLTENGWFNKPADWQGYYVDANFVTGKTWWSKQTYHGMELMGNVTYTYDTIYFAIKVGWDTQ